VQAQREFTVDADLRISAQRARHVLDRARAPTTVGHTPRPEALVPVTARACCRFVAAAEGPLVARADFP